MSQGRQSPSGDTKTTKRNSGLFSFLRWFKSSSSRESVNSDTPNSTSGSCESINSIQSSGTVASFSYVSPSSYKTGAPKIISQGPETDTYKARLKQRDKRREKDKNTTLRKKYKLFFNRDSLLKNRKEKEDNCQSLPLMTRTNNNNMQDERPCHRRTASESSKLKKAGAYCHVKGKRKAPQPPNNENQDTSSLRRKKRTAPQPPIVITQEKIFNSFANIEYADAVIYNDSLKLDHGILKPAKEDETKTVDENTPSARSSYVEAPVSPRPWYKRNTNKEKKHDSKYEPIEKLPDVQFTRNSTIDLQEDDKDKRKSGLSFLTNISELDREASRILKEHQKNNDDIPPFMRPKQEEPINMDTLQPKRRSARDLIAKFNAITNVTKVTVNSAFFGNKDANKRDYFGKQNDFKKDNEKNFNPLMKSESANVIKTPTVAITKETTPKIERKNWHCPKCKIENEYWRIICHVCSTIKPYFDELNVNNKEKKTVPPNEYEGYNNKYLEKSNVTQESKSKDVNPMERNFERSKTQIGFSILTNKYKAENKGKTIEDNNKKEEREKLKKMLIEMKNSLPKKKNAMKQLNRKSIIPENPESAPEKPINISENTAIKEEIQFNVQDKINNPLPVSEIQNETSILENKTKAAITKIVTNDKRIENHSSFMRNEPANNHFIVENVLLKPESNSNATRVNETFNTTPATTGNTEPNIKKPEINKETPTTKTAENQTKEIIVAIKETLYENIKVKKTENPKPIKVSSSAQTSGVIKKTFIETKTNFELLRPKDFADIYSDKTGKHSDRIYANLAEKDELSLFFNLPKQVNEIKLTTNTDTIEINRLLRRLENAIAKGEMSDAAIYARDLAQLKVNCSVIRQKTEKDNNAKNSGFT